MLRQADTRRARMPFVAWFCGTKWRVPMCHYLRLEQKRVPEHTVPDGTPPLSYLDQDSSVALVHH